MGLSRRDFLKVSAAGGLMVASNLSPVPVEAREPATRLPEAKGILYDATVCIGCKACMAACKEYNHLPPDHSGGEQHLGRPPGPVCQDRQHCQAVPQRHRPDQRPGN